MPETPDFENIVEELRKRLPWDLNTDYRLFRDEVVEELRQMWNARGAADIAKVEHELSTQMGSTAAGPYVKNLDRALRGLDR